MRFLLTSLMTYESEFYGRVGGELESRGHEVTQVTESRQAARLLRADGLDARCLADVAAELGEPSSLDDEVRRLIGLRKQVPALRTGGPVHVLNAGYPLVYTRGGTHLVVINPRREPAAFTLPWARPAGALPPLAASGTSVDGAQVRASGFGYGVFELRGSGSSSRSSPAFTPSMPARRRRGFRRGSCSGPLARGGLAEAQRRPPVIRRAGSACSLPAR